MKKFRDFFILASVFGSLAVACNDDPVSPLGTGGDDEDDDPIIIGGGGGSGQGGGSGGNTVVVDTLNTSN